MSQTIKWLVTLAALTSLLNAGMWLSASSWYAGWVTFVLALVAAVMMWMNK
ncbi:hypothetical protein GOV13_03245 [Candidatus Pacearchaeota archaeon]|nr:hypothetical protein [Candidatus Pacearchaeota archaeon]